MSGPVDPPKRTIHSVEAAVAANRDVGAGFRLIRLAAPEAASHARAGQFLMLGLLGRADPLLPRPFAFFDVDRDAGEVEVLYKVVGRGTRLLAEMREEERLRLTGPLGRGWRKPEGAKEDVAILVAGGTAWAALHLLAKEFVAGGLDVRVIWGQPCDSFPDTGVQGAEFRLATDDGSCGFPGTSVDCARHFVEGELETALPDPRPSLYGAGPIPMLGALASFASDWRIPLQVSLEARMACGIGVCRGCVVNAREPHTETGLHRRAVCTDGPVFDAGDLDWENLR